MAIIVNPLGYRSTLSADLMADDESIKLSDTSLLDRMMSKDDTAILQIGDGVNQTEIEITRAAKGYKVMFLDSPKSFPCGSRVVFQFTDRVINDMLTQALRDAVGDVLRSIKSADEDQLKVNVENGVATLTPIETIGGPGLEALCSLDTSVTYDALVGCKDGSPILVESVGGPAGASYVPGSAITFGEGDPVSISQEAIHTQEQNKSGLIFDLYGRYIEGDFAAAAGLFADDIDLPTGEFTPIFQVINGTVVGVAAADAGTGPVVVDALAPLFVEETTNGYRIDHEENFSGELTLPNGQTFSKTGHLIEYNAPEPSVQYSKVPFHAYMDTTMTGTNGGEGFTVISSRNLNLEEIQRFGTSVSYNYTFDTPAPNDEYSVVGAGWSRLPQTITKTTGGFQVLVQGLTQIEDFPFNVIVMGDLVDPTELTEPGFTLT